MTNTSTIAPTSQQAIPHLGMSGMPWLMIDHYWVNASPDWEMDFALRLPINDSSGREVGKIVMYRPSDGMALIKLHKPVPAQFITSNGVSAENIISPYMA